MKNRKIIDEITNTYGKLSFSRGSEGFDKPQSWLVKRFFPRSSFGVIYGKSGSLKSFLALDIAYHIATGKKWQNRAVSEGAVVYIAAEGQLGVSRRVKAVEQVHGIEAKNLFVLGTSIFVSEADSQKDLIDAIKDLEQTENVKVRLIIIDTLARCFVGDENYAESMNAFVRGCDSIRYELDACIMCIHHTGKDEKKGSRGSSVLIGACDYEFQLKRDGMTKLSTFINNKQKDADAVPDMVFEFKTVDLGIVCEDNEPITSLALTEPAISKNQKDRENNPLLKALRDDFGGQCTRDELRKKCFPPKEGVPANTTNQKFKRALAELVDSGAVSIEQMGSIAHRNDIINETKQLFF